MKRFFKKYISLFLILPFMLSLTGCIPNTEEDLFSAEPEDAIELDGGEKQTPPDAKSKEKDAEEEKIETITLSSKRATFDIDAEGRTTPFVPYRERNLSYSTLNFADLPYPPGLGEDKNLTDLVSAKVTGILFEEDSPSAIINVKDEEYLVKPGDEIEGFQISSITQDYVAIKTGSNVYRAKVGDIVDGEIYGSGIYNLGHKFAGQFAPAKEEDVLIFATKKESDNSNNAQQNNASKSFSEMGLPPVPEINPTQGGGLPQVTLKTQAGDIPLPLGELDLPTKKAN